MVISVNPSYRKSISSTNHSLKAICTFLRVRCLQYYEKDNNLKMYYSLSFNVASATAVLFLAVFFCFVWGFFCLLAVDLKNETAESALVGSRTISQLISFWHGYGKFHNL